MIIAYEGKQPNIGKGVFLAPTAVIIGDVSIGDGASIWYGAVLRGDEGQIIIGRNTNIQDNVVIHATPDHATVLADDVTIGHGALLEGCRIEQGAVIGMGTVILQAAMIGSQALVAAGSVIRIGFVIPPRTLAAGVPAEIKKELTGEALRSVEISAATYRQLKHRYLEQGLGECDE